MRKDVKISPAGAVFSIMPSSSRSVRSRASARARVAAGADVSHHGYPSWCGGRQPRGGAAAAARPPRRARGRSRRGKKKEIKIISAI